MTDSRNFEATVHLLLDAGYNLARWLMHDEAGAENAVQEAALRAFKYYKGLRGDGDSARAWFLTIVRDVCFAHLEERSRRQEQAGVDESEFDGVHWEIGVISEEPDDSLQQRMDRVRIDAALRALPPILREVIVLRDLEEMSYEDIGHVVAIPLEKVMSRLLRARARLRELLILAGAGH